MLTIQPFDPSSIKAIERAILESDLGLTPSNDGKLIRLPIPQLTEERRKELVKLVRHMAEEGRVAVRNVRRDVMQHLEELVGTATSATTRSARPRTRVQKLTDDHVHEDRRPLEAQRGRNHGGLTASALRRRGLARDAIDSSPRIRLSRASGRSRGRAARGRRDGRDHHGRERPLGPPARPADVAVGHRAGTRALRRTVEAAIDLGDRDLVVYAFSTENWSRPQDEVDALMEIFGETIERELPDLAEQGVRIRFIGRRDRAPEELRRKMAAMEDRTELNTPARPLDRVRLRRPRRARRGGAPDRRERGRSARGRRERPRREPVRARPAAIPTCSIRTSRRAAGLELPALAARVRRARVRRHALAGFRRRASSAARSPNTRSGAGASAADEQRRLARSSSQRRRAPIVLGLVYLGGWWLFALIASAARGRAARVLAAGAAAAPARAAGYIGAVLALVGAQLGGVGWMLGGVLATLPLAFAAQGHLGDAPDADDRRSRRRCWAPSGSGCGLAFAAAPARPARARPARAFTVLLAVWAGDTLAYVGGRLARAAQDGADDLAREDVGGIRVRHGRDGRSSPSSPLYTGLPDDRRVARPRRA